jgi:predicted DNA-binding transcriptional regulator YafY
VHLSQPFYGWLFSFGNKAKVLSPATVQEQYAEQLQKLIGMYNSTEE